MLQSFGCGDFGYKDKKAGGEYQIFRLKARRKGRVATKKSCPKSSGSTILLHTESTTLMPYVLFWDVSFDRVRRKPDTKHHNWHVLYFVAIATK